MTEPAPDGAEPQPAPKLDPGAFVLRVPPPRAIRFKRGLIVTLTAGTSIAILGVTGLALRPQTGISAENAQSQQQPAPGQLPEQLAKAPATYSEMDSLKPPSGRPFLPATDGIQPPGLEGGGSANMGQGGYPATQPTGEAGIAAGKAARSSAVLVSLQQPGPNGIAEAPAADAKIAPVTDAVHPDAASDPNGQLHKLALVGAQTSESATSTHHLLPPQSPWVVSSGTVIAASLITGLNSDLPGQVTAQVTENVYDSPTGRVLLIPQGARLIGRTDNVVAYGQSRALVVWQRLVLPDGSSLQLDNIPAADEMGHPGLSDRIDRHTWALVKGIAFSTLLGVGSELSFGSDDGRLVRALRQSAETGSDRAAGQITSKNLEVQPTLRVRPGWPVRVIVNQDILLVPWESSSP